MDRWEAAGRRRVDSHRVRCRRGCYPSASRLQPPMEKERVVERAWYLTEVTNFLKFLGPGDTLMAPG